MDAGRGQSNHNVSKRSGALSAREHVVSLDDTDGKSGQIIVAWLVHAGHLRRLTADQRTIGGAAAIGDAGDDRPRHLAIETRSREVIQEKQWLGAMDDQIVYAHGHQVDPDGVVAA